jgi:hypothetical protein
MVREQAAAGADLGDPSKAIQAVLESIRRLGTIRFIYLPLFLGASGSLAKEYLGSPAICSREDIPVAGLILALLLGIEIIPSRNMLTLWEALGRHLPPGPWSALRADRNAPLLCVTRLALLAPYPLVAGYWLSRVYRPERSDYWIPAACWAAGSLVAATAWWSAEHEAGASRGG